MVATIITTLIPKPDVLGNVIVGHVDAVITGDATVLAQKMDTAMMQHSRITKVAARKEF
jgi:hypothetical protein